MFLKLPIHAGEFVRECGGWRKYHQFCDQNNLGTQVVVKFEGWKETRLIPLPMRVERQVGRNEPCPCDSGKKFKKCCIK